jgi:hypothetical protein
LLIQTNRNHGTQEAANLIQRAYPCRLNILAVTKKTNVFDHVSPTPGYEIPHHIPTRAVPEAPSLVTLVAAHVSPQRDNSRERGTLYGRVAGGREKCRSIAQTRDLSLSATPSPSIPEKRGESGGHQEPSTAERCMGTKENCLVSTRSGFETADTIRVHRCLSGHSAAESNFTCTML